MRRSTVVFDLQCPSRIYTYHGVDCFPAYCARTEVGLVVQSRFGARLGPFDMICPSCIDCGSAISPFGDNLFCPSQALQRRLHMLSIGTTAVPSACSRCQLLKVVYRTGKRVFASHVELSIWNPSRVLSSSSGRCQGHKGEINDDITDSKGGSRVSEYPLGRIYGKPGRRHRETSARLTRDSMQKPFEVIVLRDVPEPREERKSMNVALPDSVKTRVPNVSQLAQELLGNNRPNENEVRKSIDALRPDTTIVDEVLYQDLIKRLVDGYNLRQLSQYFISALQQASPGGTDEEFGRKDLPRSDDSIRALPWKPGKTPLHQRHNMVGVLTNGVIGNSKSKVAEQILRLCWGLSIEGETLRVGELEIKFEAWQLRYLFDITANGKPMYESMIDSSLLATSAELRPDRRDNILRIVARKLDAETIAERIKHKFRDLVGLDVDLSAFEALKARRSRSAPTEALVGKESLQTIEMRLCCIFERKNDTTVMIHANSEVTLNHARRALLSLLDIPSPSHVETATIFTSSNATKDKVDVPNIDFLPEQPGVGMKHRPYKTQMSRLREPAMLQARPDYEGLTTDRDAFSQATNAKLLTDRLLAIRPPDTVLFNDSAHSNSFWRLGEPLRHRPWEVDFCKLLYQDLRTPDIARIVARDLQSSETMNSFPTSTNFSTMQSETPGIASLLPYFSPKSASIESPILVAHFAPSPFTTYGLEPLESLPRIRIAYKIWHDSDDPSRKRKVQYESMHAVFVDQDLRVHLPQETTDLRITRRSTLRANGFIASQDPSIQSFTYTLQRSIDQRRTVLNGKPTIKLRIPSQPFANMTDAWVKDLRDNDFEVEYLFQKFEQVQSIDFVPARINITGATDTKIQKLLKDMPNDMFLRYQEIERGIVGGRRTELKLQYPSSVWKERTRILDFGAKAEDLSNVRVLSREDTERKYLKLMEISLGLASALTKINAR